MMGTLYPGASFTLFYSCAKIPQFLRINRIFKPTSTSFFYPKPNDLQRCNFSFNTQCLRLQNPLVAFFYRYNISALLAFLLIFNTVFWYDTFLSTSLWHTWVELFFNEGFHSSLQAFVNRLSVYNSFLHQSELPLQDSHSLLIWLQILGKMVAFLSAPAVLSLKMGHREASEVHVCCSGRREESFHVDQVIGSTRHPSPMESTEKREGSWRMGNPSCNYFKCLEKWLTCSLLGLPGFLHPKKSTNDMWAQLLFAGEFYFCLHFMQSSVASASPLLNADSGFQQDKSFFPWPLGWIKSPAISSGFGWVWLNSAVTVSSWARKWHRVLGKSNKVSGSINCQ